MGQLIHQDELWAPRDRAVEVELPQRDPLVGEGERRQPLEPVEQPERGGRVCGSI